jgi:hypothetical protein
MDEKNCLNAAFEQREVEKKLKTVTEVSVAPTLVRASTDEEKASGETTIKWDDHIVDWDGPQDPQNPQNWSSTRKWTIIILISMITFNQYLILLDLIIIPAADTALGPCHLPYSLPGCLKP